MLTACAVYISDTHVAYGRRIFHTKIPHLTSFSDKLRHRPSKLSLLFFSHTDIIGS